MTTSTPKIAALFVLSNGPYAEVPGVDLWDQARDARRYDGPYRIVAHPPCERWGRYCWINADFEGGWTCCVYQGNYGHRAQKATWLYAVGVPLPSLKWGGSGQRIRLDDGYHSAEERRRAIKTGVCQRLSKRQRLETPIPFRDLLLTIARGHAR